MLSAARATATSASKSVSGMVAMFSEHSLASVSSRSKSFSPPVRGLRKVCRSDGSRMVPQGRMASAIALAIAVYCCDCSAVGTIAPTWFLTTICVSFVKGLMNRETRPPLAPPRCLALFIQAGERLKGTEG